jgi:hypothetical protein
MNIFFTTVSLALELVAAPALGGHYALYQVQCLRTGGTLISSLYIFELIYRLKMRMPLWVPPGSTSFHLTNLGSEVFTETMTQIIRVIFVL